MRGRSWQAACRGVAVRGANHPSRRRPWSSSEPSADEQQHAIERRLRREAYAAERRALEVLRQPLEEGVVRIARAARTAVFPARFMLVGAMNPCPCGYAGDPVRACRCTPPQVDRYASRLSGPLRDRLDLTVGVGAVSAAEASVRGIPGVQSAVTSSLALGGVSLMRVDFAGDPAVLAVALSQRGWSVEGSGTALRIRRAGGEAPPPQ